MAKVIVVGLGPIGRACAHAARCQPGMELVGLVDSSEKKVGLTLEELDGNDADAGPRVVGDVPAALGAEPTVAIVSTVSRFDAMAPMLRDLAEAGVHVVSSCEQMTWPWYRHAALADEMDALAKEKGVAMLGTGVNPGFVMDSLAVTLASVVRRVQKVRCVRRVDAGLRRNSLQRKVGATMKVDEFNELARIGKIGHQGIAESVALIAHGLGHAVEPGSVQVGLDPVVAEEPTPSEIGLIEPGRVCGMKNTARWQDDSLEVELELMMAVGLVDTKDKIAIQGPVSFAMKIPGAVPGDSATVAVLINYARLMESTRPGLRTMLDMPPAGCR